MTVVLGDEKVEKKSNAMQQRGGLRESEATGSALD
jgi:hypothetical protein